MTNSQQKVGKPPIVDKLEPYLKRGLSLHKACLLKLKSQSPTAYDLYNEYDEFKDKNILSHQLNQPFDRFIKEGIPF